MRRLKVSPSVGHRADRFGGRDRRHRLRAKLWPRGARALRELLRLDSHPTERRSRHTGRGSGHSEVRPQGCHHAGSPPRSRIRVRRRCSSSPCTSYGASARSRRVRASRGPSPGNPAGHSRMGISIGRPTEVRAHSFAQAAFRDTQMTAPGTFARTRSPRSRPARRTPSLRLLLGSVVVQTIRDGLRHIMLWPIEVVAVDE